MFESLGSFCFGTMVMYAMTNLQFQAVYNTLLFLLASMMATTIYLWFRSFLVKDKFQSAVIIIGLGKHMISQGDAHKKTRCLKDNRTPTENRQPCMSTAGLLQ